MNPTGKCNIRCIYCHLTYAEYYTKNEMTPETFLKLEPFLKTLSWLVYFSSTEPLAADHFADIFTLSQPFPAEKYLSTNGILLDEKTAEMLVRGGLYYLTISFGGMTRESFKTAHQVDKLDQVTRNIEWLNGLKDRLGVEHPRLRLVFVTWKDNAHELPEAVRYAHRHKFSEGIKITYLKSYTDDLIDQLPYDHMHEINHWTREAIRLGKELGVPVTFDGGNFDDYQEENVNSFHRYCREPWERFHVEADGKVRPCTSIVNTHVAGDLNTQTAEEIWNGPVFQEFRQRVNSPDPHDVCKRCTSNFRKDFRRRDIWDQRDLDLGIYRRLEGRSYLKGSKGKGA